MMVSRRWTCRLGALCGIAAIMAPLSGSAKTVLVIGPHPDDEALLGAGRVRAAVLAGDTVKTVVVTNGDYNGTTNGLMRQGESVVAQQMLGLTENDIIFMGYPDAGMYAIYGAEDPSQVFASAAGVSQTYGNRGLGRADYHSYLFGNAAPYSRQSVLTDFAALFSSTLPDEIYTVSEYDAHPDHSAVARFIIESLISLQRQGVPLSTRLYQTIVWDPVYYGTWPQDAGYAPEHPFSPPGVVTESPLSWDRAWHFPLPADMQSVDNSNLKHQVIGSYVSQYNGWLGSFTRKDEFFWLNDFGANQAVRAQVTASSEYESSMPATSAIDGLIGWSDWASTDPSNAWIQLNWTLPVGLSQVDLYDRASLADNILGGVLQFSDGSQVVVPTLPIDGKPLSVSFPARTVTSVRFVVQQSEGTQVGLGEIQALGKASDAVGNHAPQFGRGPACAQSRIMTSEVCDLSVNAYDVDGDPLAYTWEVSSGTIQANGAAAVFTPPSVSSSTLVTITARADDGRGSTTTDIAYVTVLPNAVGGVSLSGSEITGGQPIRGTITLLDRSPAGNTIVTLSSSNPSLVSVPATVMVTQGETQSLFEIATSGVSSATDVTISATFAGLTSAAVVSLLPAATNVNNLALSATASASSQNSNYGQLASSANDGIIDGYPRDYAREWATSGQLAGAWIQLDWSTPITADQVVLYDRPNSVDNIQAGTLIFSDGSTIPVGALPNFGSGLTVSFSPRVTSSIRFRVDAAAGSNVGLAEMQVSGTVMSTLQVTLASSTASGGSTVQGLLTLPSPAPEAGETISLSSSNPQVATVPTTVFVPGGATTATFSVTVANVSSATDVTISAVFDSITVSSTLKVEQPVPTTENRALTASVTASSQNSAYGQTAAKAVDGVADGYPGDYSREWATTGQGAGAWIQLDWSYPVQLNQVRLNDRPNNDDNVLTGTLLFSDGTSVPVGALPNSGTESVVDFAARSVTWVRFRVDSSVGYNVGLSEFAAYGSNLAQVTLSAPSSVVGGSTVTATVLLPTAAPAGGGQVALTSSTEAVTVPSSVLVPAGATTARFSVVMSAVTAVTTATINAQFDGQTASTSVEVQPSMSTAQNLASAGIVTSSSENAATFQLASKAVDGVVDGYPGDYSREWATSGGAAGSWIQLDWTQPVTVQQIQLFDRPNWNDNVLAGTLTFSDGSSVSVGQLPNNSDALILDLTSRVVTWVRFTVDFSAGENVGLAEFRVNGLM